MSPCRESRPYEGLRPTTPQYDAGLRVEPPVSEPKALSDQIKTKYKYFEDYFLTLKVK